VGRTRDVFAKVMGVDASEIKLEYMCANGDGGLRRPEGCAMDGQTRAIGCTARLSSLGGSRRVC
jgi:hypothetical protein